MTYDIVMRLREHDSSMFLPISNIPHDEVLECANKIVNQALDTLSLDGYGEGGTVEVLVTITRNE